MHPIEALERYWNYTSFRPLQEEIIDAVLNREDTFALLPTGGGKSICFQIPALIQDGICIVISPLIALMKDQVNDLKARGIKAMTLTSGMSYSDLDTQLDNCIYGNYKFLYLSPERLKQTLVLERIQRMKVNLIAVDEAHCISQWGNDFRPAFKNINTLREIHPHVNCIALTATAKQNVVEDIITNLDFINPKIVKGSFYRSNIAFKVIKTDDKLYQLAHFLKTYSGTSIVYVRTRRAAEDINRYIEDKGFSTTYYHGGINNKEKQNRLLLWRNGQKDIMVATTAFGMGIDKADVKTVIHFNLPESLESYYQEAGRAGRNGDEAFALLLYQGNDEALLKNQFLSTLPSIEFIKKVYNKLCNYFQVSYGEGVDEIFQLDFRLFCKTYNLKVGLTFNALQTLDRHSIIALNQNFNVKTKIQFITTNKVLFNYLESHLKLNTLVKTILRTYGGVFDFEALINLNLIIKKSKLSEQLVTEQLKQLEQANIINLQLTNTDSEIVFLKPREDDVTINPIVKSIKQQYQHKHNQIEAVLAYIKNNDICRQQQLLKYFGETTAIKCGKCSACIANNETFNKAGINELKVNILLALQKSSKSSRDLSGRIKLC